ncbi:RNA polymerase sigma-70 factor [Bernardetia sp.]|uniref:RNA polymerase sigma-70 factor n=1 Tax=Bernardetia sp. TaxID=1937974 RepID=UPI0025C62454|nr:RNA polymerase sigma-70 factor [Bernardetia sp.]
MSEAKKIVIEDIEQLFKLHYASMCRTVFRMVKDEAIAEDIVQDVFFNFWKKKDQLNITTSVAAYLKRSAANAGIDYLRKKRPTSDNALDIDEPIYQHLAVDTNQSDENIRTEELSNHIETALEALPPRCKEVFMLNRFEDMSYQEVADTLGISIKTVENQMGKALKILRVELKDYLPFLVAWLLY